MGSKMQTSLLLIIGTVVSLVGWMFIYPVDGGPDSTAADNAADIMADERWQLEMAQDHPMLTLVQSLQ